MKQPVEQEDVEVEDVPVTPLLSVKRGSDYGSVPDLEDEELAEPWELERQVMAEEWGPILALPVKTRNGWGQPGFDESGGVDFGAFGTVDFERTVPEFDKARYKAEKLRDRLADLLILLSIVKERVPGRAKYLVLKYLKLGIIDLEHIANQDMRAVAELWVRARRMQQEIAQLRQVSATRQERRMKVWLES